MDREQEELQFLGFFGILKESFKIIFTWRKIFSQITLALILPLCFIFLAQIQISHLLFMDILRDENSLELTRAGTPSYAKISDVISSELITFLLFKAAYVTFFLILSLLSTAAVVYAVACIYTAKDISFKKVMSVVPKVWKRLVVTFLWSFAIVFVYNIIAGAFMFLSLLALGLSNVGIVAFVAIFVLYLLGLVYITLIWQLAGVVSVLEDVYGFKAMVKSKTLIKGKMGVALALFLLLNICSVGIETLFQFYVVYSWWIRIEIRILISIICFLLLLKVILFVLVAQTVVYFVCKSYHHESIDKSSLADHLEVYLGEYVPLKARDIQMEQLDP